MEKWTDRPAGCPQHYEEENKTCQECEVQEQCVQGMFRNFMGKISKQMAEAEKMQKAAGENPTAIAGPFAFNPAKYNDEQYIDKYLDFVKVFRDRMRAKGIEATPENFHYCIMNYLMHFHQISMPERKPGEGPRTPAEAMAQGHEVVMSPEDMMGLSPEELERAFNQGMENEKDEQGEEPETGNEG